MVKHIYFEYDSITVLLVCYFGKSGYNHVTKEFHCE